MIWGYHYFRKHPDFRVFSSMRMVVTGFFSKKSATGPTEQTPKPEYLIAPATDFAAVGKVSCNLLIFVWLGTKKRVFQIYQMFRSGQTDEQTTQVASTYKAFGTSENIGILSKVIFPGKGNFSKSPSRFSRWCFQTCYFLYTYLEKW